MANRVVMLGSLIAAVVLVSIAFSTAILPAGTAQASGRLVCSEDKYDTRPRMGTNVVARKNRHLIRCVGRRFHVPVSRMLSVANCESSFWSWAHNGSYRGLYQHDISAWDGRARTYLQRKWFPRLHNGWTPGPYNARANAFVTAFMARAGGWGPWACA